MSSNPSSNQPKNHEILIEKNIGINFINKDLLHTALIHRSYLNENPSITESNERLEFLGDAVLEFVVSEHLYQKFPKQDEGHLTTLRARLVNTISLSETARSLDLGQALFMSRGEEKGGGRDNTALLANTTEALIGALYLDQGIEAADKFIQENILAKITDVVKHSLKDAKSILQEYVQSQGLAAPVYKTISADGPDHAKKFTLEVIIDNKAYATGVGPSKQIAAQDAAEKALLVWKKAKTLS